MRKSVIRIWIDLKELLEGALAFYKVDGWTVRQNFPPAKGNWPLPVLVMRRIRSVQYGAQGQIYRLNSQALLLGTRQCREDTFQIDALCSRVPGTPTLQGADLVGMLAEYFSGPFGVRALREKGYFLAEKINACEEPDYTDEHDVFEFNPFLQIKLFYVNTNETEVPAVNAAEFKGIKGV